MASITFLMGHSDPYPIFIALPSGKTRIYEINSDTTPLSIKEWIEQKEGIPLHEQRLSFGSKELIPLYPLITYGIQKGSTLELSLKLLGGMHVIVTNGLREENIEVDPNALFITFCNLIKSRFNISHQQPIALAPLNEESGVYFTELDQHQTPLHALNILEETRFLLFLSIAYRMPHPNSLPTEIHPA